MWTYTLGPLLAFFPARWRKQHLTWLPVKWGAAGFLSGLLEVAGFFPLLVVWYSYFVTASGQVLAQTPDAGQIPKAEKLASRDSRSIPSRGSSATLASKDWCAPLER